MSWLANANGRRHKMKNKIISTMLAASVCVLATACGSASANTTEVTVNSEEAQTVEAIIVQIADAISAARPGARRETVDNYVKRLENLEDIAKKFPGVEQAYAIQAGRELRILVNNEKIPDDQVKELAKNIAKQIENDLRYPGRIKITMIRETRIVDYAR